MSFLYAYVYVSYSQAGARDANLLEKITKIYQKDYKFVVLFLINLTPQAITNPTKITREKTDG